MSQTEHDRDIIYGTEKKERNDASCDIEMNTERPDSEQSDVKSSVDSISGILKDNVPDSIDRHSLKEERIKEKLQKENL